jgi:DNA end-binding protein Ku
MMAYTLRWAYELRDPATVFGEIKSAKIDSDQLTLAKKLIRRNSAKFDPSKFKDDYEAALREVIEAKMNHKPLPREAPRRGKVINLTDALRRSLDQKLARRAAVERRRVVRREDHLGRRNERGRCWSLPQRDGARRLERRSRHSWGVATERRRLGPAPRA